jgi:hypothetical protein
VPTGAPLHGEVPLWRLNLLRLMFLIWFHPGLFMALPPLFEHDPASRGMLQSMLGGLWVMSILGLRYPLGMLPIFLFEMAWKRIGSSLLGSRNGLGGRHAADGLRRTYCRLAPVRSFSDLSFRGATCGSTT